MLKVSEGPWTMEEDLILINYIANHGENTLAKSGYIPLPINIFVFILFLKQ